MTGLAHETASAPESIGVASLMRSAARRAWLVLAWAILIGGGGTAFTLWQTRIYHANARILIEPPRAIIAELDGQPRGNDVALNFFQTRVQMIASRRIAERVLQALHLSEWDQLHGIEDPVGELVGWIEVKPVKNSNLVDVSIEGNDAELVARIVNTTVDEFVRFEQENLQEFDQLGRTRIEAELRQLQAQADGAERALLAFHKDHPAFLLSGESVEAGRLSVLEEAKVEAELRLDASQRRLAQFASLQQSGKPLLSPQALAKIEAVRAELRRTDQELAYQKDIVRPELFETDVAVRRLRDKRRDQESQLKKIEEEDADLETNRLEQDVELARLDLEHLTSLANQQRSAALNQQDDRARLARMQAERDRLGELRDLISQKRLELDIRQGLVAPRIQVLDPATVPHLPSRPIVWLQIPAFIVGGLLVGLASAILVDRGDRTIRTAEQVEQAVGWPVLGCVPYLPRASRAVEASSIGRGRRQIEALEAFRDVRAAILGRQRAVRLRSLLVTSADASEGKSLIACHLAATCARAGESTLLVDLDLRRPSVRKYFEISDAQVGIVDVLTGEAPVEKALVVSAIPNLSLLCPGTGGVDVLGTAEMARLIEELTARFDRVVMDAPPMLGLADARVAAPFADGMLIVTRSRRPDARRLLRLRRLCEQEGLRPLGIVLNGYRDPMDSRAYASPLRVAA